MSESKTALYLVPTPIGNMEDITLRAIRILREVDLILAEDTRTTGLLLQKLEIKNKLHSYHNFNEHKVVEGIVQRLLNGEVMALVSDAGTPAISDPGFLLVRECLKSDVKIECLPGPTAFVPALVKSGLAVDRFTFEGFLPHKKGRQTRLKELADEKRTMIFYESPHRIIKSLEQFTEYFGEDRLCSISREISKYYEETVNGTVKEVLEHFKNHDPKGEFVMVIQGKN
ncbi:16S rRNA (cytidine(1402)-2'-O)-methyltransferase [Fulvivirgaceae bacterium LMO-SS25]